MLQAARLKQLHEIINTSTKAELQWINSYLDSILIADSDKIINEADKTITVKKITILYGTETGNAKSLALQFASIAKKNKIVVKFSGLDQYRLTDITKEENLFIIVSTHGEGEPPEIAKKFYDYIHQTEIVLDKTNFSVLALGDSAYPLFCKTGEDIDAQLVKLGASRSVPLQKCDVDFETEAHQWFKTVLKLFDSISPEVAHSQEVILPKKTGKIIYNGTIINNINLNDKGSNKETYHIEIIVPEKIDYEAGDALATVPKNNEHIVDSILALTGTNSNLEVATSKFSDTTRNLLINNLNISYLLGSTIKKYGSIIGQDIPLTRMDLLDLIKIYPLKNTEQFIEVLKILTSIAPRLYTISSSPKVHEQEVHILVRRDEFIAQENKYFGLCSSFLGEAILQSNIQFYIHKNKHFKLPANEMNIIMIGPGTGIAPFRSFLAERDSLGSTGKNWLFFGEQYFQKDFLYQTEIQHYLQTEVLHKISLAFSRDQQEKVYVQHKLLEQGKELFNWIENGAYVYISGSKEPMSIDVEDALLTLFQKYGNKTKEEANSYFSEIKKVGRYQKEVY